MRTFLGRSDGAARRALTIGCSAALMALAAGALPSCQLLPGRDADPPPAADTAAQAATDTWVGAGDVGTTDADAEADAGADIADAGQASCDPPCTAAKVCDDGVCAPRPCKVAADCNDPALPTNPMPFFCPDGVCRAWQCGEDKHCAAGEQCNTINSTCFAPRTGCALDAHCIDDDVCTDDTCDKASGACKHTAIKGCCKSTADCDDANPCTLDACGAGGMCAWSGVAGCCVSDKDCDDGGACTQDTCAKGKCHFAAVAGCCKKDADCDDGDVATSDTCVGAPAQCLHALASKPKTCKVIADCLGDTCAAASCIGGQCSYAPTWNPACCGQPEVCPLSGACKAPSCDGWQCGVKAVAGGKVGPHQAWDFEAGLGGWAVDKGNQIAYFHAATGMAAHGSGALRYGIPQQAGWKGGLPNKGTASSPAFVVPGAGVVRFAVFFDGEPAAGVHQFGVDVTDKAGKVTAIWSKNADLKGNTGGGWKAFAVPLAAWAGQTVQLRLWFDVAVAFPNEDGKGLHFDAIVVEGVCP